MLGALYGFAPFARAPEREEQPVSVRFVPHTSPPAEEFVPPRATDRRALPLVQAFAPIPIEPESEEPLPAESSVFASELPAVARRMPLGVGASGALRVPHARAPETTECGASTATTPAPAACAPGPLEEATPPLPLACPPPAYPAGAASVGEGGRVRLEIRIDSDGRVESVRVLSSSGFARLDEAAELGVRSWRFRPARRAGSASAWRLEHTIVFRVDSGR